MRFPFTQTAVVPFLICASLLLATRVQAQNSSSQQEHEEIQELELEEIVVSDTRLPSVKKDIHAVPAKVTVITAEDIQQSGAKTVQEAIQDATGIVMYDQVGNAFQQTIDLRGFNGQPVPGTTVFVDGVRVNEPDFNTTNFELIDLETVERIEILPGASAIYGKDALGGVINIITKKGIDKRQATGAIAFGSFGRERYNLNLSGPIEQLNFYTNLSHELEDGFRDDSDATLWRVFNKMAYQPTEQTDLDLSYTYVNSDLKQASSLPLSVASKDPEENLTPGDRDEKENHFLRFNGRQEFPFGLSLTANSFYRNLEEKLFTRFQPATVGGQLSESTLRTDTDSWGAAFQLDHDETPFGLRNLLIIGGEVRWDDFDNRLSSISDFGPFQTDTSTDEFIAAVYVENTLHITPKVLLRGGMRYDRDEFDFKDRLNSQLSDDKVFDRVTPRASLTYLFAPSISAYFNYSQGFRVPTNNELFALGPFGSNPNLQAVRSNNFELGFKTNIGPRAELTLALYQANVRDEIFFTCIQCDGSLGDGINRNIDKTRRRGIEATAKWEPNQYVEGVINYTFTEAQFRTDFSIGFDQNAERVESGDSFPLVPKNRLSATVIAHPTKEWSASLTGLYVSTQFLDSDESNTRNRLQGYFVLNSKVAYNRAVPGGLLSGFLMFNNMLDNEYFTRGIYAANRLTGTGQEDSFVVPAPGIAVYGGLSYQFESPL